MAQAVPAKASSIGALLRAKWYWFLILGVVLIICGAVAIVLPVLSSIAASIVLGAVLTIAGVVKVVEALQVAGWAASAWQMLVGAVEIVGGILIYVNPVKRALAITLVIAIVFLIQGLMQIAFAFKLRPQEGWGWMLFAGVVALGVTAATVLKVQYMSFYPPGMIAGLALMIGGWGYLVIAFAKRRGQQLGAPA